MISDRPQFTVNKLDAGGRYDAPAAPHTGISTKGLRPGLILALLSAAVGLSACADGPRPDWNARYAQPGAERPHEDYTLRRYASGRLNYDEIGIASWYGAHYQNRPTADGEIFDMNRPTAAHNTLPLPCLAEVTNLANGRRIVVRVNDRGPIASGRLIDLSRAAASELGFLTKGVTRVRVRYLGQAE
jgi:rare lipoprotein A (peptidoglycan hydrolase)